MEHEHALGKYGRYGGRYVPETLMESLFELEAEYARARTDPEFRKQTENILHRFVGRPTPLRYAGALSRNYGCRIYLKREDLCHTGAHKINNCVGQVLLARKMGKRRIIAETGAGQHGVAAASACAALGCRCVVYMGKTDFQRQSANLKRMEILGAEVVRVDEGSGTLKEAVNAAVRDWVTHVRDSYYLLGSVVGPHPYPLMVRDFQSVIGREAKRQILNAEGRLPRKLIACIGGGSNAMGLFFPFLKDIDVELVGVEAGGRGKKEGEHSASLSRGVPGVLHGAYSYLLHDDEGQILPTHSISAGLDYPGVGPELSCLKDNGRLKVTVVEDDEVIESFYELSRMEGIIPALESAHALAYLRRPDFGLPKDEPVVINVSGRGDKDMDIILRKEGDHGQAQ